jgi:hypothetical protein
MNLNSTVAELPSTKLVLAKIVLARAAAVVVVAADVVAAAAVVVDVIAVGNAERQPVESTQVI